MNTSTKAVPMTKDETMLLVQLVAGSAVINNKATNATNNKMKDQAWQTLAVDFNSSISSSRRTPAQLRLKWENLKKAARKRCAIMRISRNKTGGGKDYFPPDEVLDKVASLLGSTCTGFSVEFGGDATVQDSNLVINERENIEVLGYEELGPPPQVPSGTCGGGGDEREVLQETQVFETPPPQHKNFYLSKASGSGALAKRKHKMEEEKCKARTMRENALTEYLLVKKKKIELENSKIELEKEKIVLEKRRIELENEEKELNIAKLKLELGKTITEKDLNYFKIL